ncbi:zinc-binding alcohol dehydrogenase family protein [Aliibacillus thermotolerans]|uniref:Zinc-binding alcohol dehydrogenase family protein n=1 Tax=Aliibacillus thermotolerans TaxID=1834418 RepID=A0ABW0UA15_9BACI|nr:zinc-binding dehydrogenase [Aliibacillus thermotolerans]
MMKAILVKETGGPDKAEYVDVDVPSPGKGEVLIRLKNAALNRRDFFITHGLYPGMNLPAILGSDGAGIVEEVGEGVSNVSVGDEVIMNPGLQWGENEAYGNKDFHILGMPTDGTYAQYVKITSENVYQKPSHLSWEEAAALPLAGLTAYRALFTRGELKEGENVLVPGIGSGVSQFVMQMALAKGANVYVTSSSEEKIARAKELGASGGVNYQEKDWTKQLKKLINGFDLIVDGVGGDNFNQLLSVVANGGRIVNYGATAGPVPELVLPKMFFKNMDIRGTTMGSPRDFQKMLDLFEEHSLHPVVDKTFALEDAAEALKYMEKGNNFGKIVLEIPQ